MADTQQNLAQEQNASATEAKDMVTAEVYQQKAEELQQVVAQQVMGADTSKPTTMTELLADDAGAFAAKAQELGLSQEWQKFKDAQPEITSLREEFMKIEEQRSAAANQVADISPQLEQEAAGVRKNSTVAGAIGAAVSGAIAAFGASKKTPSTPLRIVATAAGAVFGGAVTAIMTAKKSAQKRMGKIEEQVGDLSNLQPDPELEKRAGELQEQLGTAQQNSMESMVDSMVERMAQNEIAMREAHDAALAQEAAHAQAAQQQAASAQAPEAPQAEAPQAETLKGEASASQEQPQPAQSQPDVAEQEAQMNALLQQLQQGAAEQAPTQAAPAPEQRQQQAPMSHADAELARREQQADQSQGIG